MPERNERRPAVAVGGEAPEGSPPRVALVGFGRWGRFLLGDLVDLGAEVVVVLNRSDDGGALEGGAVAVVHGVENLPQVEAAVVATPSSTHAEIVEALLPLGFPVFCEKPLTTDPEAADRLADLAPERLFVMDKWRYHPGIERLAQLARGGELGPVVGLETTRIGWGRPHRDVDTVWTLAPHDLAIALEILGSIPEPLAAVADFADGEVCGLTGLLGERPWMELRVSGRSHDRRREVTLRCQGGVASLAGGYADHVRIARGFPDDDQDAPVQEDPVGTELPTRRELRAFLHHLRGGPPPRSSAAEGVDAVRAIARLRTLAGLES